METEGCYNYPETNTSALCTPRVPLSQPGSGKQMYLIFWKGGAGGGAPGGEKMVKGEQRDESRTPGWGRTEMERDAGG